MGNSTRSCLAEDFLCCGNCVQLFAARLHCGLMISGHCHASGAGRCKSLFVFCQALYCLCEIAFGYSLVLFSRGLQRLFLFHIFRICFNLVIQRLFKHIVVVLSSRFRLAQISQLALGFLLHVLENIKNAPAVAFVYCCCRCSQLLIVRALLRLHKCHQVLLILSCEGCCIDHCTKGLPSLSVRWIPSYFSYTYSSL